MKKTGSPIQIKNPILTLDCQSQSNPSNWIAIRIELSTIQSSNTLGIIKLFFWDSVQKEDIFISVLKMAQKVLLLVPLFCVCVEMKSLKALYIRGLESVLLTLSISFNVFYLQL